jgi:sporulation protein YlmC with PRC-barrel domain
MYPLHQLEDLSGFNLQAMDGEIGKLQQIYFDDQRWKVRYLVVRTGSWLLGREVLILPEVVTAVDTAKENLTVDLTCKKIENSPLVDSEIPVSRHYEQQYLTYYGRPPYWTSEPAFWAVPEVPGPVAVKQPADPEHPHLRSSAEVHGYRIKAKDEEIGRVADFIIDQRDWSIRFLVINTGHWFAHHHILVSPSWLLDIDWAYRSLSVNLTTRQIKTAPEYDSGKPITAKYEKKLFEHYRIYPEREEEEL